MDVTTGNLKIIIIAVFILQTNRYSYYDTNKPQAVTAISHSGSLPFLLLLHSIRTEQIYTHLHISNGANGKNHCESQIPPEKVTSLRKFLLQIAIFFF